MKINPLTAIDFYKVSHRPQYPEGTNFIYCNFTPRSNKLSNLPDKNDKIVFFGLQYFIKDFLIEGFNDNFFNKPKEEVVKEYKRRLDTSLGGDNCVKHIEALHDLGYLPLEIRALPEGSLVNMRVPCLTIHNTHPDFFWLVNYIESVISAYLWKPCVSATTAKWYRDMIDFYAEKTGANKDFCQFQGHDFSFRGMSGVHDAAISGAGHLLSFTGTDTVPAIDLLEQYYNANAEKELIGCSVPASEHSVMTLSIQDIENDIKNGKYQEYVDLFSDVDKVDTKLIAEYITIERLLKDVHPDGIVSLVCDSYDFWGVLDKILPKMKNDITKRNGKLVVRPDSGNPVDVICGLDVFEYNNECEDLDFIKSECAYIIHDEVINETPFAVRGVDTKTSIIKYNDKYYSCTMEFDWNRYDKQFYYVDNSTLIDFKEVELSSEQKGAIQCLWETFGGTVNDKGYKELDAHIGLIYGDSITPNRAREILRRLEKKGFASSNVVFGIGSATYQGGVT